MESRLRSIRRTLKACTALFKVRVAERLQYRVSAMVNSSVTIFYGFLQIAIFTVFFTFGDASGAAITLEQTISYIWLAQILYGVLNNIGIDADLREKIIDGNVALELCRPLDLYSHWFAQVAAERLGGGFWRMAVTLLISLIAPTAFRLSPPDSASGFVLFLISVCGAFLLCAAFSMLLTAIRLGLTWGDGPIYMIVLTCLILNGGFFPLQLWPDFLQGLLLYQPFAGILDIPLRLYIGSMPPTDALWAIGLQLVWTVIFIVSGKILMGRKLSHLIVQGS